MSLLSSKICFQIVLMVLAGSMMPSNVTATTTNVSSMPPDHGRVIH